MNQMLAACQFLELEGSQAAALDRDTANWLRSATLDSCPYLAPDPTVPRKRMEDFPDLAQPDMLDDVRYCQAAVEAKGMEFMVHNFTRRDLGMPVVKVIVPGMRHFWARFAPGRLYDVPVSMGWLRAPLDETQLNPVAMFI
jgi:ribosomal protein S12 methylthiotransferase accessory factor